MALTQQQREAAEAFLRDKLTGACPSCGGRTFQIADLVSAIPFAQGGGFVLGATTVPLLLVVCGNCFHVLTFAAVPLGLVNLGEQADAGR